MCQKDDTISRKAAIDAVHKNYDVILDFTSDGQTISSSIEDILSELPSAQPEVAKDTNVLTNDCISRQEAIDAINGVLVEDDACKVWFRLALQNLPSAQPERKKGKWIDYSDEGYVECPFCHSATNCDGNKDELHFCFSCGADMRGERDD